jgi:ferredoxin
MPCIKLHTDYCIASGACVLEAPKVFEIDDNGVVAQIDPNPVKDLWPTIRRAAAVCPVAVIEIEED